MDDVRAEIEGNTSLLLALGWRRPGLLRQLGIEKGVPKSLDTSRNPTGQTHELYLKHFRKDLAEVLAEHGLHELIPKRRIRRKHSSPDISES